MTHKHFFFFAFFFLLLLLVTGTLGAINSQPISVEIDYFIATQIEDYVVLEWATTSEQNNQGFNLYRNTQPILPANALIFISSQAPGSGQGAVYNYKDHTIEAGSEYYYWLQDIENGGASSLYGPITPTLAIFTPTPTPTATATATATASVTPSVTVTATATATLSITPTLPADEMKIYLPLILR